MKLHIMFHEILVQISNYQVKFSFSPTFPPQAPSDVVTVLTTRIYRENSAICKRVLYTRKQQNKYRD